MRSGIREKGAIAFRALLISQPYPRFTSYTPTHLPPPLLSRGRPLAAAYRCCSSSAKSSSPSAMPGAESQGLEWPAKRVRDTFVKFFEEKAHVFWKSSPVVPHNDPTLLFANAGSSIPILIFVEVDLLLDFTVAENEPGGSVPSYILGFCANVEPESGKRA